MTQPGHYGKNYYAVQTYSGLPGARRVQVGWMAGGEYPGMPFNQQMSFPYELTLRRFGLSLKLCALPVREIESLRGASRLWNEMAVKPGDNPLADLSGELWDIEAEIAPGSATDFGFRPARPARNLPREGKTTEQRRGFRRLVPGERPHPTPHPGGPRQRRGFRERWRSRYPLLFPARWNQVKPGVLLSRRCGANRLPEGSRFEIDLAVAGVAQPLLAVPWGFYISTRVSHRTGFKNIPCGPEKR